MEVDGLSSQESSSALSLGSTIPPKPERNRKKLKLDQNPPKSTDIAKLRQQICDHKRKCQEELRDVYRDNLTELFYLQNGVNFMDVMNWKKRPNLHLKNYLKSFILNEDELEEPEAIVKLEPTNDTPRHTSDASSVSHGLSETTVADVGSSEAKTPTTESFMEQAKKEAQVMQRVAELRKKGLWSARRMPKVQEPARNKAHWDYLLEEMQWLAADFAQERKWKKAGCRKISRMITRYHQDRIDDGKRAEKEEGGRLRRIAGQLAKQVKDFWSGIEKVVQYKHDSRLDEKRRQALDMHLSFIVDQTEKYSTWLSAGLAGTAADTSGVSRVSSAGLSPRSSIGQEDMEFEPNGSSDDDEETIAREEELSATDQNDTDAEIAALQAESEMPIDQLLASLPQEVLNQPAQLDTDSTSEDGQTSSSEDFNDGSNDAADNENTLDEQEQHEEKDYDDELDDLKNEGEMTVEELAAKYAGAYASDFELPYTPSSTEVESDDTGNEDQETSSSDGDIAGDDEAEDPEEQEEIGMEYLLHPEKDDEEIVSDPGSKVHHNREITDIAAAAQSLQPTGYTLETTVVKTPIPFLLKHTLREYQHVGLDWLATMYDKKLNGILADEMGLGKTIQTIALLAHLACEHSVWGPHLIVVPTSVMLNWEMELKKWCPGLKILTYYGSQKERKLKRVGWTKTNAFHVCITSYKLVIQDHVAFRRKKWRYLILDEAQNIKNFKSQRWQTLLNFNSQRRLLLTGTPLQNNLMELWSLMHFLMPNVFQSHMEFKEWFANPLTGMIEGTSEYNDQLIRRLHKVLRPFLLRRLKADVERQLPKKYEHVVMCRLSKRQRFLYEEFMSRRATKDTLSSGNFMSVINILMQLRKVCNHPDMFDPRPIISPFETEPVSLETAASVLKALDYDPFQHLKLDSMYPNLANLELSLSAYAAHRSRKLQTSKRLIEMVDDEREPPIRPPPTKLRPFVIRSPTPSQTSLATQSAKQPGRTVSITSSIMKPTVKPSVGTSAAGQLSNAISQESTYSRAPIVTKTGASTTTSQPITLQIQQTAQGTRLMIPSSQLSQLQAGLVHIIQTSSGQHLITSTSNVQTLAAGNSGVTTSMGANRVLPATSVVASHQSGNSSVSLSSRLASATAASPVATLNPIIGKPALKTVTSSPSLMLTVSSSAVLTSRIASVTSHANTSVVRVSSVQNGNADSASNAVRVIPVVRPTAATTTILSGKAKPVLLGPASRKRAIANEARNKLLSELKLESLHSKQSEWRKAALARLALYNRKHCGHRPVYGIDLHEAVDVWTRGLHASPSTFQSNSAVHCYNAMRLNNPNHPRYYWNSTNHLQAAILSAQQRLTQLSDILERFVFLTPPVKSPGVFMHAACRSNLLSFDHLLDHITKRKILDRSKLLHPIQTRMLVQFPEKRLIQYDCGKLQTLDILLRDLKSGKHRALIFTQMTRMLDVLETFLNYHGHRYLRLDGTTKVEMRQQLMDRFNADNKIFVFILSTRSGGIGVNLTGADTVIFYDSDWNPTMDAQAQDRCHRIGQTRDVHIYRLVSEKTVEENILKKANQKRMLGDVAIEGGNFTTASLQQGTITDLFAEPTGLDSLVELKKNREAASSIAEVASLPVSAVATSLNEKQFEQALCQAEDAEDVQAAAVASEEAGAELAEFDEDIPWDEREAELKRVQGEKTSKVEQEIAMLEKELTAVERYAVTFLEQTDEQFSQEAVEEAEMDIEQAKKDWELNRLKTQRDEEERKAELEEDDMLYTYSKEDGMNQAFKDAVTGENMPMWCPPTPPHSENDMYVDQSMCFLYDTAVMTEAELPPVHVKKEKKRRHDTQPIGAPKKKSKLSLEEAPQQSPAFTNRPPRSLFDRPLKLRREKTPLRHHGIANPMAIKMGASGNLQRPGSSDSSHQDQPEWLIHEDWSLLQAVQTLLQLPLNLLVTSPAHIPNWDLVSDIVSTTSRIYRSPKQCKLRYENVIIPREEGKLMYDINPRKPPKKIPKSVYKTKGNKSLRTGQLYTQDSGSSVTTLHAFRFDCIKNVASKRTPTLRPTLVNPTMKNPKHAAVIADSGIQYDSPMNPEEVAKIRQERIKNEKTKAEQQRVAASQTAVRAQGSVQLQHIPVSGTTAIISPATKAAIQGGMSIARNSSIVVSNSYTLNRKLSNQATSVISGLPQATARKMTVQEIQQLQLRNNSTVAHLVKHGATVTGISQGGTPRTITVQQQPQQPISIGGVKQQQFNQLNILSQHQAKQQQRTAGATLVAQRATSAAAQLLTGQLQQSALDQSRVPTLVKTVSSVSGGTTTFGTIPVSAGVNINVSLPQQQKQALGTINKASLTGAQPQQFRQIQLLHNKQVGGARPLTQKLSLSHPQLVGKSGASVQIVQQKIGSKQIGVQQIQQLIKQQQAAAQHAQIITTPGNPGVGSAGAGQTIIATTQLLTPANMHATITKMAPHSASGVGNVTVSLARPASNPPLAIISGAVSSSSSSLVAQSPSKLVATTMARPTSHRAITGIVSGGTSSVVSLSSVTLQSPQSQPSVSASLMGHRTLNANTFQAYQQQASSQAAARAASSAANPASSSSGGTTVLQQTILTNKPLGTIRTTVPTASSIIHVTTPTPTPSIVAQTTTPPTVVVPVDTQLATITNVGNTVTVATTPAERTTPSPQSPTVAVERPDSPIPELSEMQSSTPDATRTYAMRPRKTN